MFNENLYHILHSHYALARNSVCLELPDSTTYTYGEIDGLAAQMAAVLLNEGVQADARVVVQIDKSPGAVALYLACLRIGAIYVPLNTAYTDAELEYFLDDASPAVFVCQPEQAAQRRELAATLGVPVVMELGVNVQSELWARAILEHPHSQEDVATRNGDDIAAILYTSGTTGRPKGAMLTHQNLASNALILHELWCFEPGDVLLHALPIFHVHGLFVALHCAFLNISRILFHPGFDVELVRRDLQRATVMMGVPTFYTRLLDNKEFSKSDCVDMRLFISGSAPLNETTFREFQQRTGHTILERYGMSETGMITSNPLHGERIPQTVGFALPAVEVQVCDDSGAPLPVGETGMVEVRGPNVFAGYWQMEEKTREEKRQNGFFKTGDLGSKDIGGRLTLAGRDKDLIISGGYNIYPVEIETVLNELPGVKEAAVIGIPDADFGEAVLAVILKDETINFDEALAREAVADKLARFKHPKRYECIDELPRNAMGKVQKKQLRETFGAL